MSRTHIRRRALVPPEDVAGLAAGICALIEDPGRRRAMGAAAAQAARDYSITTVARRWETLFADLTRTRAAERARPHR